MSGETEKKRRRKAGAFNDGEQPCAHPRCDEAGEYRAPVQDWERAAFAGRWKHLCLEHVRQFNAGYDYFDGMAEDDIYAAQHPLHGWADRTAWADGRSPSPRWADFADPIDAIGARFRAAAPRMAPDGSRLSDADAKALKTLGLTEKASLRDIRSAYSTLLRRYHPDRNGGDRSHEDKLQAVLKAWAILRKSTAFK